MVSPEAEGALDEGRGPAPLLELTLPADHCRNGIGALPRSAQSDSESHSSHCSFWPLRSPLPSWHLTPHTFFQSPVLQIWRRDTGS